MMSNTCRGLCVLVLSMYLGGCAGITAGTAVVPATPLLADLSAQAADASGAGQPDKALAILENATKLYPADKTPWVQMAQIKFDAANYGEAIVNALEALNRDPQDQVANSIVAVSGLRLSSKALADLRQQNNLSGSVRTEAQDLAKLLRDSLGETELVPVAPMQGVPAVAPPTKVAPPSSRPAKGKSARGNTVKPAPNPEQGGGSANPFGALK